MPKRTVRVNYYTTKKGQVHDFGSVIELDDDEAKRGDSLGAFEESDVDPSSVGGNIPQNNLNVQTPATHVGKEGLTGTRQVVPELEDSEPDKDEDLPQDPANDPGDEADPDEFAEDGELLTPRQRKAQAAKAKKPATKAQAKPSGSSNS